MPRPPAPRLADPLRRWLAEAPVAVALVLTAAIIAASGALGFRNAATLADTAAQLAAVSTRAAAYEALQAAVLAAQNAHLRQLLSGAPPDDVTAHVGHHLQRLLATPPAPGSRTGAAADAAALAEVQQLVAACLRTWDEASRLLRRAGWPRPWTA